MIDNFKFSKSSVIALETFLSIPDEELLVLAMAGVAGWFELLDDEFESPGMACD